MARQRYLMATLSVLAIVALVLAGCGATATPTTAPTSAPKPTTAATTAPTAPAATAAPTKPAATATTGPAVGGNFVYPISAEPDSLDSLNSSSAIMDIISSFIGASLVTIDPAGKYVPYLADSWTISPDGKTWEFKLKKNIKFHDGTACTAKDYVYTFQHALDPALKLYMGVAMLSNVASVEAPDDATFRINLKAPYFAFAYTLSDAGRVCPVSKAAVEKAGTQYGRSPMSVGPYKFKEWATANRIVLERNADFKWGPPFLNSGAWYIQTVEFRVIPEVATQVAGLEAGEIDMASLLAKDVARIQATGKFQIFEGVLAGNVPSLWMNTEKWPFDDLKVRQAFEKALDRENMIKVIAQGQGEVQAGPLSKSMTGYSAEVEKVGYKFDLAGAKALMKDAGWSAGADGILVKDGKPLKIDLRVSSRDERPQVAEVVKEQLKALGVVANILQTEHTVTKTELSAGNFQLAVMGVWYAEADILFNLFHSSMIDGGLNWDRVKDPDLDKLLEQTQQLTDPVKRQEAVTAAQVMIVQKAYMIPLYTPKVFYALSTKWKGAVFSAPAANSIFLSNAYLAK